jgi:hypothetical protein
MQNSLTPNTSLWRQGFQDFGDNWQTWAKLGAGFLLISALLQITFYDPALVPVAKKWWTARQAGTQLSPEDTAILYASIRNFLSFGAAYLALTLSQSYFFVCFFLKLAPVPGVPVVSVSRFIYSLAKVVEVTLLIGVPGSVIGAAFLYLGYVHDLTPLAAAGIGAVLAAAYCLQIRYYLTLPLAICGIKPVLHTSLRMTRGNFVRILKSVLTVMVILGCGAFAALMLVSALKLAEGSPGIDAKMIVFVKILAGCVISWVTAGVVSAFHCAVYRILGREQNIEATGPGVR